MSKLTKQNVGGVDYTTVGCALTATCDSAASDYIKVATLSDGDAISDGMHVVCTFTNGNTAGTSPDVLTIYSSDQVNYYSDDQLTVPFTLAPEGCYSITYTGTGNAYSYKSWICLSVGGVTGIIVNPCAGEAGGTLWSAGNPVVFLYSGGRFRLLNVGLSRLDLPENWRSNPASIRAIWRNNQLNVPLHTNEGSVLSLIETMPAYRYTIFRGFELTDTPVGSATNDFIYYVTNKLESDWIRVVAYDVRSSSIYTISKINNVWGTWRRLLDNKIETITGQFTTDANGNLFTGLSGNYEILWIKSTDPNLDCFMSYSKNITDQWWCRPISWSGSYAIFPNTTFSIEIAYRSL